ncbi:hypothetical protein BGW36DRAFT_376152 [Talaromyces proteolyticus]|uniref:Phytanoyl-CoA dioxygenase n=1 Tax=Talaromyces proteolyticus TaxID=1131652 RepID=A0AAD4KXT8_9EURO|nr:uncharacterized protein BGW36DRAFT_376152 [Talaromyces proteolyticus]KAH8698466.1 hypothetical protein BGW36DRAFT_376152 [Talaromyces proteolyticus]
MASQPKVTLIKLSPQELSNQQVGSHNLQHAVEALHRDGMVVLENAVDPAHLDKLNGRMVPEAKQLYAKAGTHRNFGAKTGNIQQEPIVNDKEYIFQDVLANPFAVQVVECMFGPRPSLRFYSANTAFKADTRQPVHIDVDFDFPQIPWGYAININLVSTTPENGATEVWLGSHTGTTRDVLDMHTEHKQIKEDLLEERRKLSPGIQPSLPKGSLIIRDMRLWHAGMPNRTDDPRIMLVSILFPQWYRSNQNIVLPKSLQEYINWGDVDVCVDWVGDDYDYLKGAHDHDFALQP